ncbi:MAG: dimethyl sulfoxide reductase anchor subunit [Ramlibacter sp.]|nr:dimethyl sulfoxide reductase anchor subunit [Ramlibacter sp.]
MSYGPNPWQQAHWDWRAAGNFICGGAGSGLVVFTLLSDAPRLPATLLLLAGLALVGLGLLCVWFEIGRPLRALNVFFNPHTSWMSREALVSLVLFGLGLGLAAGVQSWGVPAVVAALAFMYCQGRIVQASRGIPAWREPLTVPLFMATGLAEGAGLFWVATAWQGRTGALLPALFGAVVLARWLLWRAWRRRIAPVAAPKALAWIDRSGRKLQWLGSAAALALAAPAAAGLAGGWAAPLLALAGLLVAATGIHFKFTLITRASFNQGFALSRLPVRGVPRT